VNKHFRQVAQTLGPLTKDRVIWLKASQHPRVLSEHEGCKAALKIMLAFTDRIGLTLDMEMSLDKTRML
jgi:hypothetical protein